MGIACSTCVEKPKHRFVKSSAIKAPRARVYPLLCHLEEDFKAMADEKGQIGPQEFAQLWEKSALRRAGKLSKADLKIIHEDSQMFFSDADLRADGAIDFEEFATFMLGGNEDRGNFKTMRNKLQQCVKMDPQILSEVIQFFRKWDKDGDGFLSRNEIQDHLTELKDLIDRVHADTASAASIASASTSTHHLRHKKPSKKPRRKRADGSVPSMVEELHAILGEADAGADDKVDLWELLAHVLGRRRTPVELLLYDISDGIAEHYSTLLLGVHFEAIYHSGIVAFGYEYWYGGSIFRLDPPSFSAPPLTKSSLHLMPSAYDPNLRTVHLGYTLATEEEFCDFLDKHILDRYTRETYDVLTHNCNCFTNEAAHYLLGAPIPEEISSLPQVAMNTPMAQILRPFLNHWLGSFRHKESEDNNISRLKKGSGKADCSDHASVMQEVLGHDVVVLRLDEGILGEGRAETTMMGSVLQRHHTSPTVDVRVFDHETSEFVTLEKLPMTCIIENRSKKTRHAVPERLSET